MSIIKIEPKDYSDGRTKQAFADACDINKILKKAQRTGSIAHLQKYDEATYGEFENYDLLEAYQKVERANEIFADLPSEVRKDFNNDALKFAGFASDPQNISRLAELLPAIAEPGAYFPNPVVRGGQGAGAATAPAGEAAADGSQADSKPASEAKSGEAGTGVS